MTRGMVNHIDLTVTDPARSKPFYERMLDHMGYVCVKSNERGAEFDLKTPAGFCSVGIARASGENARRPHDRYSPGLHHLAWTAQDRADVDRMYALLKEMGATILDAPADYPQYGPGYYAVFFADPDGLKLEYVHWPK